MTNTAHKNKAEYGLYQRQNRKIHHARSQIGVSLDDCRLLAKDISGRASISSLTLEQRFELIEELKKKGARVYNPPLSKFSTSQDEIRSKENPQALYGSSLEYWNKRFPERRPGYATNEQLAWISALWKLDIDDGRYRDSDTGLRRFIYRQTKGLDEGPVSDLAFLRFHHVSSVITPLKVKARKEHEKI